MHGPWQRQDESKKLYELGDGTLVRVRMSGVQTLDSNVIKLQCCVPLQDSRTQNKNILTLSKMSLKTVVTGDRPQKGLSVIESAALEGSEVNKFESCIWLSTIAIRDTHSFAYTRVLPKGRVQVDINSFEVETG